MYLAAGGIGTTAFQLVMRMGLVNGVVSGEHKATIVQEVGANHVIGSNHCNFIQQVHDVTDGKGAPIILDSISGEVSEKSTDCLASYGRVIHIQIGKHSPIVETAQAMHGWKVLNRKH
ncbi:zinc-binding dehydrogenase [Brevibacillus laterosporus]|uniref:zinc-binding dehydrogenase n=1 Tax=Brevibacillus laterosporus TaxID=1465 RepID=UPI003D20C9B3